MMRGLPADYLSMCVGINIYGIISLGPRAFGPGIVGFVQIVREGHPDVPFVVMSPIYSPPREAAPNAVGFTLQAMRGRGGPGRGAPPAPTATATCITSTA